MTVSVSALPRPIAGAPPVVRAPRPEEWTLPNGLRVWSVARPTTGQVVLRLVIPAGAVSDTAELSGRAALAGRMMLEGTERQGPDELNERLDELGASLNLHTGHDFSSVSLSLLPDTLGEGLALLGETLATPRFPERELDRLRAETLDGIAARLDEPAAVADDRFGEELFGTEHPYGRAVFGNAESVARLARADLVAYQQQWLRPEGSTLVVCGAYEPAELRALLADALGAWSGTVPPRPDLPTLQAPAARRVQVGWEDAEQAELRVGSLGLRRTSPDWFAAQVANYLLGGSTITSRLGQNLREDKGWTYGVRASFSGGIEPGGWTVETAVDDAAAEPALAEIEAESRRLAAEGPEPDELQRAKDALLLGLARAWETPSAVASRLSGEAAFQLGSDYWDRLPARIGSVSAAEVMRIADEHFVPERTLQVVVGSPRP